MSNSNPGLPSFFTSNDASGGFVDDRKYESLLADLRAHDLLGTEGGASFNDETFGMGFIEASNTILSSHAGLGDFLNVASIETTTGAPKTASSAPPGFTAAEPSGFAPTQAGKFMDVGHDGFDWQKFQSRRTCLE